MAKKNQAEELDQVNILGENEEADNDFDDGLDDGLSDAGDEPVWTPEALKTTLTPKAPARNTVDFSTVEDLIGEAGSAKKFARILIYGKNKTGKTTFAGVPGALIIKMEDGTLSIRGSGALEYPKGDRYVQRWEEVEALYWYLRTKADEGEEAFRKVFGLKPGDGHEPILVFDTLTRMRQLILRQVIVGSTEFDPAKDILYPSQRDHGAVGQKMTYWLSAFADLPVHILWLAQERSGNEDADSPYEVFPDLPQSVRSYVMSDADVIGRTYKREIEKGDKKIVSYRVMFNGPEEYVLGDRTKKLPKAMANANVLHVIERMFSQ